MTETPNTRPPAAPAAPAAPATRQGFLGELWDAVAPGRTFALVIGVLLIEVGFVFSYVGAFHRPVPHRVSIAVAAPLQISGQLVGELNAIHGHPLHATAVSNQATGRTLLRRGSTSGVVVVNPTGKTDALFVASGGGAALATAVEDVILQAEAAQHRSATVTDAVPAQPGDARGLTDFYLVVGWLVGGYLVAALLGIATRPRPATTRRAIIRLIVLVPYAIASGLAGAIIVEPVLGALTGHLLSDVRARSAHRLLRRRCDHGLPSPARHDRRRAHADPLRRPRQPQRRRSLPSTPPPRLLARDQPRPPNGAGVQALRRIVYFGSYNITGNLLVISAYIVVAATVALTGTTLLARRPAAGKPADAVA